MKDFDAFSKSLARLLSHTKAKDVLIQSLGVERSNFVIALQVMKRTGDLDWLDPLPGPILSESATLSAPESNDSSSAQTTTSSSSPSSSQWPPPLPKIRNPLLRQQALTHRSKIKGEDASIPGVENMHYERLEFLGDAYLQSITSQLLYDRFPSLREGSMSEMRQALVSNRSLARYAFLYDLQKHIVSTVTKHTKEHSKIIADSFEAYIGAIVLDSRDLDDGIRGARSWLAELFEPKIQEMGQERRAMMPVDKMAKQNLHTLVGGTKECLLYKWTNGGGGNKGGYWITVIFNGWGFTNRVLGKGWGKNKSDAELRAAMNILADIKLIEELKAAKVKILGPKPTPNGNSQS